MTDDDADEESMVNSLNVEINPIINLVQSILNMLVLNGF